MSRSRAIGALFLVAAALAAYIAFVERRGETTDQKRERARRAVRFDPDRVDWLRVESTGGVIECRREGGEWFMVAPTRAPADAGGIQRILFGLETLPRGAVITAADRRARNAVWADYGLEKPRATFALGGGGGEITLHVGLDTPLAELYVRVGEGEELLTTSTNLLGLIPAGAADLRDRALFHGSPSDIRRLQIKRADGFLQFARGEQGEWTLQQPVAGRADRAAVEQALELLLRARIQEFVRDGTTETAPYGFDDSAIEVTLDSGGSGSAGATVQLGRPTETNPELLYARFKGSDSVVAVASALRSHLAVRTDDWRDRRLLPWDPGEIVALRIARGDRELAFQRGTNGWDIASPAAGEGDPAAVEALLREWTSTRIEEFLDTAPTGAPPPSIESPLCRVILGLGAAAAPTNAPPPVPAPPPRPERVSVTVDVAAAASVPGFVLARVAPPGAFFHIRPKADVFTGTDPLPYRRRDLLALPREDILRLTLVHGGTEQAVEQDAAGTWTAATPGAAVLKPALERRLAVLARLRAAGLIAENPASLAPYGLDPPVAALSVGLRGEAGLVKTLLIGRSTGSGTYAMIRGQDVVFVVDDETAAVLQADLVRRAEDVESPPPRPAAGASDAAPASP